MSKLKDKKEELRQKLSEEEYRIIVEKGTELPGTGKYLQKNDKGIYCCKACSQKLFKSNTKFPSDKWPSFYDAIQDSVNLKQDKRRGLNRTEVVCSNCGGHLGHVFNDGPEPTGKRYCINSKALEFKEKDKNKRNLD